MFGNTVIDLALGMILVFLLVGLLTSTVQEAIASGLKLRAANLKRGLGELLTDPELTSIGQQLLQHGLLDALRKGTTMPSYIPSATFASALTDIVFRDPKNPSASRLDISRQNLIAAIDTAQLPPQLKQALLTLANDAAGDIDKFKAGVAKWFDAAMDRVGGWYKRTSQKWQVIIGFALAALLNIDALSIGYALWNDAPLRGSLAAEAQRVTGQSTASDPAAVLQSLKLPIGWDLVDTPLMSVAGSKDFSAGCPAGATQPPPGGGQNPPKPATPPAASEAGADKSCRVPNLDDFESRITSTPVHWACRILGWAIIAISTIFGAPFWFDALKKVVSLRGRFENRI